MLRTSEYWDANYYCGANPAPAEWRQLPFHPNYDFNTLRDNWALQCRHLRDDPDLKLCTITDFIGEFGGQAGDASVAELAELARRAAECEDSFWTDRFSAAEILDLLARWYLDRISGRDVEHLARRSVLGPAQMPLAVPTV